MNSPVLKQAQGNPLNTSFGSAARAKVAPEGSRQAFLGKLGKSLGNKLGVITAVTSLGTAAVSQKTDGAIVATQALVPASEALGAAQQEVVWVQGTVNGNIVTGSGHLVRGKNADFVITAAHNIKFAGGTFSPAQLAVGNGNSYINDRGTESGVSSIYISSTFVPGSNSGLDYAFLELNTRLSSPTLVLSLGGQPEYNSSILFAGYGLPSSMLEGPLPNSGNVMGFTGSFSTAGVPGWNSANDSGWFTGEADLGVANYGDSGGPVKQYDPISGTWKNIGIITGSDFSDATIFFPFYNADVNFNNFLNNVVQPVIPEPSTAGLLGLSLAATALLRNRRKE